MAVTLSLNIKQNSQSVANNTSNVTVDVVASWTYGSWNATGQCNGTITIDGTTYSFSGIKFNANHTTTGSEVVMTKTVNVTHNSDGTKTLYCSSVFNIYLTTATSVSGSGSATLTTIARASQPSCITYPNHTQNVGEFGKEISIHMNRKSSSFTHTVRYQFGSQSGTIATGVTTGTTWVVPLSLMNLIPSSTSGSGTIYVDTYNGSTLVGTKYCGFTATVPASVKPSCSFVLEDITGVDDKYGSPVKGLSQIKVTVSATKAYSSDIKSYSIKINGATYNTATANSGVLLSSGSVPVNVTVTDARGRSGSSSYTMTVKDYNMPAITKLTAIRCNQDGTANKRGEYVKVTFSAVVSSMSDKNAARYSVQYKVTSEASYTTITLSALTNNYTPTNYSYIFPATLGKSYDVVVTAGDSHYVKKPITRSIKVSTASAIFSWRGFLNNSTGSKEEGAGIGKVPEKPNTLQVGWESEFEKDIRMVGAYAFYGAQGITDTRNNNETPEWYMTNHGRGVVWEFKSLTALDFTAPTANFGPLQTIIPWKDNTGGLPRQVVYEGNVRWTRIATSLTSWGAWVSDSLRAYPVGSIYIAYNHTSPASLFGGTWTRIENRFLWATTAGGTIGGTGGEQTHTLSLSEIPSHSHTMNQTNYSNKAPATSSTTSDYKTVAYYVGGDRLTNTAGGGGAHNNMPPYIQVSIWRRTA